MKIRNPAMVPPGGWHYPVNNLDIRGASFETLVLAVAKRLSANREPVPSDLADKIENWIAERIPENMTYDEKTGLTPQTGRLNRTAVEKVTSNLLHDWRANGRVYVSKTEAERRGAICWDCKRNSPNRACLSCAGIIDWVRGWILHTTASDKKLRVCDVCMVMNIAQVHMDAKTLVDAMGTQGVTGYPETCWKVKLAKEKK